MQLTFSKLVQRIREEFDELAALRLSLDEAADFFALELDLCTRVLATLTAAGVLVVDADGRYRHDDRA